MGECGVDPDDTGFEDGIGPRVLIDHCVIYYNPDDVALSVGSPSDAVVWLQSVSGSGPWAAICNNVFLAWPEQPRGTVRIRPMLPEEVLEHRAWVASQATGSEEVHDGD